MESRPAFNSWECSPSPQARENLAELIDDTHRSGEPVVLTRAGRPVAVMLDHAVFESLLQAVDGARANALRTSAESELGLA